MSADSDSRYTSSTAESGGTPTVNTHGSPPVARGGYSPEEWAHKIRSVIEEAESDGYVVFCSCGCEVDGLYIGPEGWDYENPQSDVLIRSVPL